MQKEVRHHSWGSGKIVGDVAGGGRTHQIKVQVVSDGVVRDSLISGEIPRKGQRTLAVNASRGDLSLNWQFLSSQSEAAPLPAAGGSAVTLALS